MSADSGAIPEEKTNLHFKNKHKFRYNFPELIASSSELSAFVSMNPYGDLSIDFKNPLAVKALNKALLKHFYGLEYWSIPDGYLCPPIPGRADYIHYAADLLAEDNNGLIPAGAEVKVLDIGVGANCIYPLLGFKEYGWSFKGSEIDGTAIKYADAIIVNNQLQDAIKIKKQKATDKIFNGVIEADDFFHLTICNPPFHSSLEEALYGTNRKWKNLGEGKAGRNTLNFGGKSNELWCKGGELEFIYRMIKESVHFSESCLWFTSLISKKETLKASYKALERVRCAEVKTINMAQGQKVSRLLCWTFFEREHRSSLLKNHKF